MSKKAKDEGEVLVCRNAKAAQRYEIESRIEAGLALVGSEVKSLRARQADLEGAYASIEGGELWLYKMHVAPYTFAASFGHEIKRPRKLLVHGHEIQKLEGQLSMRGFTLIPLRVYFKNGRAKVELGLGRVKKIEDKRQDLRKEADARETRAAVQRRRGG